MDPISEGWKKTTLGEVAICRNGAGIKQKFFMPSGVPLARVSDFTDNSLDMRNCIFVDSVEAKRWNNHRLKEGDIIVATVGSWPPNWSSVVGKTIRIPRSAEGAIQNQNSCCILARVNVANQRFLFYLLRNREFVLYAANSAGGSANQARLPVGKLERFNFLLPPLSIQHRIAHILGSLDDKIELNRKRTETLEEMLILLYKHWFIDFQYFRGETFIEVDSIKGVKKIPESFKLVKFRELADNVIGGDWGADDQDEMYSEKVQIIRGTDIPNLDRGYKGRCPVRYIKKTSLNKRCVKDHDIVIEISGGSTDQQTGRSLFITNNLLKRYKNPLICASFCRLIRTKNPEESVLLFLHMKYLYQLGKMADYEYQPIGIRNFQYTIFSEMEELFVPCNPEVLKRFYRLVRPMIDLMQSNENLNLTEIRDTLLPKLMSGEINVSQVNILNQEAG